MYAIVYRKAALKALQKAPAGVRERVLATLASIAVDPAGARADWRPLTGRPYWRLRVGGWRAICEVQHNRLILLVVEFGPRGDVYK